jgi:hypothetical protein
MLKSYKIDSRYKLCAISKAAGILRNYRKALRKKQNVSIPYYRIPYCRRSILTTCYGLSIREGFLCIPAKIKIPLNKRTLQILSDKNITIRSVTITPDSISISVLKNPMQMHCEGMIAIDRNLGFLNIRNKKLRGRLNAS